MEYYCLDCPLSLVVDIPKSVVNSVGQLLLQVTHYLLLLLATKISNILPMKQSNYNIMLHITVLLFEALRDERFPKSVSLLLKSVIDM